MKVIVAGGRSLPNKEEYRLWVSHWLTHLQATLVLNGGAFGADLLGAEQAILLKIPVSTYPADWPRFGRKAGPIRNREMVRNADVLLTLPGGAGTADIIHAATGKIPIIKYPRQV